MSRRNLAFILDLAVMLSLAGLLGWLALTARAYGSEADNWTGRDKQLHAAGGFAIGAVSYALVETFAPEAKGWKKHALAIGASVVVGAAKEYADSRDPANHSCDFRDFAATAAGGVVGSLSASLVFRF